MKRLRWVGSGYHLSRSAHAEPVEAWENCASRLGAFDKLRLSGFGMCEWGGKRTLNLIRSLSAEPSPELRKAVLQFFRVFAERSAFGVGLVGHVRNGWHFTKVFAGFFAPRISC